MARKVRAREVLRLRWATGLPQSPFARSRLEGQRPGRAGGHEGAGCLPVERRGDIR